MIERQKSSLVHICNVHPIIQDLRSGPIALHHPPLLNTHTTPPNHPHSYLYKYFAAVNNCWPNIWLIR